MKSEKYTGLAALLFAGFLGGAVMPGIIRAGVATIHPVIFTFLRASLSAIALMPFAFKYLKQLKNKDALVTALILGTSMAGNTVLFSFGVSHTTLIVSQLMYSILPITTGIVGFLWLKEKMPSQKIIGALIAIIGVSSLIIFSQRASQRLSLGTLYGNLIILCAVCSYTMFMIFSKKYSGKYPTVALTMMSNLGASLVIAPLASYFLIRGGIAHVSIQSWIAALSIGFISAGFYFLIQFGLKRLSTVTGAIVAQLNPEFAALTGVLIYSEKISFVLITSLLLVTSGVILSLQTEPKSFLEKIVLVFKK